MKALVYTAPYSMELRALPEPTPGPAEVLLHVSTAGICGSDVHGYQGRSRIRIPPMVMGHEFTARIAALGDGVHDLAVGQRVVVQPLVGCGHCVYCRNGRPNICPNRRLIGGHLPGAFAQYVTAPVRVVYPMPDRLSDAAGALVEPLGNAVHMIGLGGGRVYGDVIVLGAGTLGLLTVVMARLAGARHVIATDVDARRLEVAREMGADLTLDAASEDTTDRILEATGGGAGLVIDAAGFTAARRQAIAIAAPGATVVLLGLSEPNSELPVIDVVNREITLRGSYSCTDEEFRRSIGILADGKISAGSWVQIVSLDQGPSQFEQLANHSAASVRVMFDMGQ